MRRSILALIVLYNLGILGCKKPHVTTDPPPGPPPVTLSGKKDIISFIFKSSDNAGLSADVTGVITGDSIFLSIPYGTSASSLKPAITHTGVSVSPDSGLVQNFTSPVHYIVTAENKSTKDYFAVIKIIIKSTVYTGSGDGKLYALDGETGVLKWSYSTGGQINSASPAYYNGTVFIGSADNYLHAVDAATGLLKWKFYSHGDLSYSTPVLSNDVLYFGGVSTVYNRGCLYALNPETGNLLWEKIVSYPPGNVTVSNGIIYMGSIYGLGSYDALTGQSLVSFNGVINYSNPAVVNGILYTGTETTVVTAYNAETGTVIWDYRDVPGGTPMAGSRCGPTVSNGTIYNGGFTKYMYALDSATGAVRWKFLANGYYGSSNSGFFSSPTVANGMVYAGNTDTYFYAIDAATGTLRWQFGTGIRADIPENNGTVKGDVVYLGKFDSNVYALNAFTGAVIWTYATGGGVFSGPCVVTDDKAVYTAGLSGEHQ